MKRTIKIVAGAVGTILIIGATLKGYIELAPWHIGTSVLTAKSAIAIFLLCSMFPYMLASGLLHSGESEEVPAYESGAPLGGFAADDERSSNMTRTVTAVAFAVIVMGFCILFPLMSDRIF